MRRSFTCAHCVEGRIVVAPRFIDPTDPYAYSLGDKCEDCDGEGNDIIEDENGLILADFELKHDPFYWSRPVGERYEYTAKSDGCVGHGHSEGGAVRMLLEKLAIQAEDRAYEAKCAADEKEAA